ncbi:hypothetical protein [Aureimonas psammosilenae]|uniref:hypothetical protein n=1 Tax=Aureimonas psammosilenae TaxID=2495496 RepID=UPI001260ACEF|nr:hypothetical protein [Aureimonas psammosilenae]
MASTEFDNVKYLASALILAAATTASAQTPKQDYQSCDLKSQQTLQAEVGGNIKDPLQAHVSRRGNVLQADIGNARKARHVTQREADALWQRVEKVRTEADGLVVSQGFLSAAERASYDRELDDVASVICR